MTDTNQAQSSSKQQSQPSSADGGLSQPQQPTPEPSTEARQPPEQKTQQSLFSRPHVRQQLRTIFFIFAFTGIGFAGSATLVLMQLEGEQMLYLGGVIVPATISMMFVTPTIIGAIAAVHTERALPETGTSLYTVTALPVFIGAVMFMVLTTLILGLEVETGLEVQEMMVPFAAAAAPAALTAVGIAWCTENTH